MEEVASPVRGVDQRRHFACNIGVRAGKLIETLAAFDRDELDQLVKQPLYFSPPLVCHPVNMEAATRQYNAPLPPTAPWSIVSDQRSAEPSPTTE
jgi:hypothetical protein